MSIPAPPSSLPPTRILEASGLHAFFRSIPFVFAVGFVFLAMASMSLWRALDPVKAAPYYLFASFHNAEGLKVGDSVSFGGVEVGRIESINLDTSTMQAYVKMAINLPNNMRIPVDSIAAIQSLGLLGRKAVRIVPGYEEEVIPNNGVFDRSQEPANLLGLLDLVLNKKTTETPDDPSDTTPDDPSDTEADTSSNTNDPTTSR